MKINQNLNHHIYIYIVFGHHHIVSKRKRYFYQRKVKFRDLNLIISCKILCIIDVIQYYNKVGKGNIFFLEEKISTKKT